ncbi:MAG: endonuclease III [Spirochaetes bacterium]|nr:endonuclease III [Spirochaetota bacterium]
MAESLYDFEGIVEILKTNYDKTTAPSVTLISNTLKKPFNIFVSTIISLRTKDQVTLKASQRLFEKAPDIFALNNMNVEEIARTIYPAGFYKTKAENLKSIAKLLIENNNGNIPDTMDELLKLPGVGRKTANLTLILGYQKPGICVDTHVHKISNRLGWVDTKTPEETEFALLKLLPERFWRIINDYLVSYGQTVCVPVSPFCSKCGLENICQKNNITRNR